MTSTPAVMRRKQDKKRKHHSISPSPDATTSEYDHDYTDSSKEPHAKTSHNDAEDSISPNSIKVVSDGHGSEKCKTLPMRII